MKKALAIIAYDRAEYFALVLPSILSQKIGNRSLLDVYDLHIFQDGFCHGDARSDAVGHTVISQHIRDLAEGIGKHLQADNLGVALHFDFAERHLFETCGYDFVIFCEDDLILAPGYLDTMDRMAEKFHGDRRIGMFSANPMDVTRSLQDQRDNIASYAQMGHNWAFGLYRTFWDRRRVLVDKYLTYISNVPYRSRPTQKIFSWLKHLGFNPAVSSQDYIKQCATVALGGVRIATFANLGLPIGRLGLHSKPEVFKNLGFDRTVVLDQPIERIPDLDDASFRRLYLKQAEAVGFTADQALARLEPHAAEAWQRRVRSGELDPDRVLAKIMDSGAATSNTRTWTVDDIPARPHMEEAGLELLSERLRASRCYLEYGAGGSTVLAAEMGVRDIHTVESDAGFLRAVKEAVMRRIPDARVSEYHVDIGPTTEWGNPVDHSRAKQWPNYAAHVWRRLAETGTAQPDLILIDGRFRVACCLASAMLAPVGTRILFDDYHDRPHYHVVERYLQPVTRAGRMAEFVVDVPPPPSAVIDLLERSTDFG